jgi:hypothetical protein
MHILINLPFFVSSEEMTIREKDSSRQAREKLSSTLMMEKIERSNSMMLLVMMMI